MPARHPIALRLNSPIGQAPRLLNRPQLPSNHGVDQPCDAVQAVGVDKDGDPATTIGRAAERKPCSVACRDQHWEPAAPGTSRSRSTPSSIPSGSGTPDMPAAIRWRSNACKVGVHRPASNRALRVLADALRTRRAAVGSRWRRLSAGEQSLLVLAHLNKGETYTALAGGFGVGTTTVFRYVREGVDVLADLAPSLNAALDVARRKAFVILDGTLLSIDRVGMASGCDRAFFSGKHKRHGVNVQVLADPAGRLVWASPALPGARHDMAVMVLIQTG